MQTRNRSAQKQKVTETTTVEEKIIQRTTTTTKTTNYQEKPENEPFLFASQEEEAEQEISTKVEVILSSTSKKLVTKNKRVLKQQAKNVSSFNIGRKDKKKNKGEDFDEEESSYEGDETINSQNKRVRKNRDQISLLQDAYDANGGHLDSKQQQQLSVSLGLSRQQIYKWCWDQKKKKELELSAKKNVCPDEFGGYSKAWLKGKEEEEEERAMDDITKIIGFDVTQKAIDLICESSPKTSKRFIKV